jgi:hypothetical protein
MVMLVISALLLLGLAGCWAFGFVRRVDGRTASDWLAVARHASLAVSYRAEGVSNNNGRQARFTLEQGMNGQYTMEVNTPGGPPCMLGYDGTHAWYRCGTQACNVATGDATAQLAPHAWARIVGTGQEAGRAVVRLWVKSGPIRKTLALDRETGVALAMTTIYQRQAPSTMRVERITYVPIRVAPSAPSGRATLAPTTEKQAMMALGHPLARPHWLPDGFTPRGIFHGKCDCCGGEMITLRYGDGLRALTLFEMAGRPCMMGEGCQMTPTGQAVVQTRTLGALSVTAVGELSPASLKRVLQSLQP